MGGFSSCTSALGRIWLLVVVDGVGVGVGLEVMVVDVIGRRRRRSDQVGRGQQAWSSPQ